MMSGKILQFWSVLSSLCALVFYFILDKKGKELRNIKSSEQSKKLAEELVSATQRAKVSANEYEKASRDYNDIKSYNAQLVNRLLRGGDETTDRPDAKRDEGAN